MKGKANPDKACPKNKVATLAVLATLEPSYSVAGIVASQIKLLAEKGHQVVFITTDDFSGSGLIVSEMFNIPEADVRVVSNFVDVETLFDLHLLTSELITEYNLLSSDIICVYPTRMVGAKQPDKIVKLLGHIKRRGLEVRLVFCNSYCNAQTEKEYITELRKLASENDLSDREVVFTSEHQGKWAEAGSGRNLELGVPRRAVIDLMRLSDLFILPSLSEACSLIMLEAAISKNLMVLNDDLFSMHEFGGQKANGNASERSVYFSFGSVSRPILHYNPSEEAWLDEHADAILTYQLQDPALQFFKHVRKRYTADFVYYNQLEPLLRIPVSEVAAAIPEDTIQNSGAGR